MPSIPTEKLIQRQIHQWNRYRELLATAEKPEEVQQRPIITISREMGSGARELARALAERLDLEIHGISIIDEIARDARLERRVVESLDERVRSQIDMWVAGVLKQRIFLRDNYHVALARAVRTLASHGGVVFLGRGANLILEEACSLRILMVAALDVRVRNVMRYEDIDENTAREQVERADRERRAFIEKVFHVDPNACHHYDLVLNTEHYDRARLIDVALAALEARGTFRH
jgi:cytidylate kinase